MKKEEFTSKKPEKLRKEIEEYAAEAGIKLNPDEKVIEKIINGLLVNRKEKGENYCPCRVITGDKKKDEDIICPCVFHRGEIEMQGHCLCLLFVR
jgi:ferredoxin-thioredoxin reductase catalytic chain